MDESYPKLCSSLLHLHAALGQSVCDPATWSLRPEVFSINGTYLKDLLSETYHYARENVALINVYIKDPYVTRLKRDEAFPTIVFVAGFGGLFGVFTGFSFISAVEVLYFFADWVYTNFMKGKRSGGSRSPPPRVVETYYG